MTPRRTFRHVQDRARRIIGPGGAAVLVHPVYALPPYMATLGGRVPEGFNFLPSQPWPGDAGRGAAILGGTFVLGGHAETVPAHDGTAPWHQAAAPEGWRAALESFGWLRDLRASGGDNARAIARGLIDGWIDAHRRWDRLGWRADIVASRLTAWLSHAEFLLAGAEPDFADRFRLSLSRQARHLARTRRHAGRGLAELEVLKALIYAELALPGSPARLLRLGEELDAALHQQVLGDGGHVERSPAVQLAALRHLIDIRAALRDARAEIPAMVQTAIDRMAPMLRFFRHGDGGLALFNGATEEEGWLIDMVLTQAEARGKPLSSAPHSGFERLVASRTLVLADVGRAPPPGLDRMAHAGTLSFEMSIGKERLVVNCGAHIGQAPAWRDALRATAAHSTLVVEDSNSSALGRDGLATRPGRVTSERREADGNIWIDASHDGYVPLFGLTHRRRLYLGAAGDDLRGEDTLSGPANRKVALRFHLHPNVRASLVQRGSAVLLRLASGAGWRFRATGGVTALQESVYLGDGGTPKRTEQIVVSAATGDDDTQIKWAFTRLVS